MNCRHCGKQVKPDAVGCISCGMDPGTGDKFCHGCGVETKPEQVICVKCGVSLSQKQSKNQSQGKTGDLYEGIYCSSDDKIIFGLCGGLAHKFGLQTSIVRVVVVFSAFFMVGWLYFAGLFLPKYPTKK